MGAEDIPREMVIIPCMTVVLWKVKVHKSES
jgi:hypothetical protein